MDKKGTHTIQSILDVMTMDAEEEILAGDLKGHIIEMALVYAREFTNIGSTRNSCSSKSTNKFLRYQKGFHHK